MATLFIEQGGTLMGTKDYPVDNTGQTKQLKQEIQLRKAKHLNGP